MKTTAVAFVATLGIALSGCATILKGSSQSIAITTPPTSGAECTLSSREGNWSLASPGVVTVEKSKEDIQARCSKPGWQDAIAIIPSDFQGWTLGNAVLGGFVGLGVDAATGAINEYPSAFQIPMFPISGYAPPQNAPSYAPSAQYQNAPPSHGAPPSGTATAADANGFRSFDQWKPSDPQPTNPDAK